jgi:hypothetical protein
VLAALAPDQLAIALAALAQLEQEETVLQHQWQLRVERARYEAERARRQFDAVEPENRLVARTLERAWEEKLRTAEQIEQQAEAHRRAERLVLTSADRDAILALAQDLPALWQATSTTAAERKRLLRVLVKEVIVDQQRARGQVWLQLNWQTGACTEHWLIRRVQGYAQHADGDVVQQRVQALNGEGQLDAAIAALLTEEGLRTTRGGTFSGPLVWRLRKQWGIPTVNPAYNPDRWPNGSYAVQSAAAVLGVYPGTIFQWLRHGVLTGQQLGKGLPWQIALPDERIADLQARLVRTRRSPRKAS